MDVVAMPALFSFSSRRIRMPAAAKPIARAKTGSSVLEGEHGVSRGAGRGCEQGRTGER